MAPPSEPSNPPPDLTPPPPPDSSSSPPSPPSGDSSNSSPPADNSSPPSGFSPPSGPGSPSPPSNTPPAPSDTGSTPAPPGSPPAHALWPPGPGVSNGLSGSGRTSSGSIVAGLVSGVIVVVLLVAVYICIYRRKKRQQYADRHPRGDNQPMDNVVKINQGMPSDGYGTPGSSNFSDIGYRQTPNKMGGYGGQLQFSYEEMAAATNGFSQANVLGQGGFGYVFKGVLPDKREVAIKTLKAGSGQGEREFQAEVDIISRVHHRHLVSLVGYCIASDQRMLVYEYVPNKTLEYHLHGKDLPAMNWATRLRIAIGSAKGLAYLHEDCSPRIIHRDIKSANILLDTKFEAMVADFGLAKLSSDNFTHVSTRVMGTFGYLAPEYAASGKLTEKSDVFSFGVMLLEIITGRQPIDPSNRSADTLIDWARPLMTKAMEYGNYSKLVDPRLGDNYNYQEMARMVACANASIRHSGRRRPRMSQVMRVLDGGSLDELNESTKPGQVPASTPEMHSDLYDTRAYNADLMKFRKMISDDCSSEFPSTSSSKP